MSEPNIPSISDRQKLLDAFADQPTLTSNWTTAYSWVKSEGDYPNPPGVAGDIPADEMIAMADRVRVTSLPERYGLMTQKASTGRLWFDIIEGFSSMPVHCALNNVITTQAQLSQAPFHRALDIGTGVGNSLAALEQSANYVVGIDRNQELLRIARQRVDGHTLLVAADVRHLPFPDTSFDLITSVGVEGALDRSSLATFYEELARVLTPGGSYLSAFYNHPHMPAAEMDKITQTSKAMLADMICDTVSGGAAISDRLDDDDEDALFAKLGLQQEYFLEVGEDQANHVIIKTISKARER